MDKIIKLIATAKGNWKALIALFVLGGITTVAGVLGVTPVKDFADGQIKDFAQPIVSATVVE